MHKLLIISAAVSLAFTACRSNDKDENESKTDGGDIKPKADAKPGSSTSIYDVQSDATLVGNSVSLRSVVVTAIDNYGGRTGGFYVQESEGGAFSGVFVEGGASGLALGDIVDVEGGVKDEFSYDFEDGNSITQVVAPDGGSISVTKVGSGTVPEPEVLDPWDLAVSDAAAEPWEGVLIRFNGVRALAAPRGASTTDDTLVEMSVTGPFRISSSLSALGASILRDDCFSSVTGIGDYFFNYKLLPRSAADMVVDASGASCFPLEDSEPMCSDALDNDYNGFIDCADFSCQQAVPACVVDTTVVDVQNGTVPKNTRVRLTDVVVTALTADKKKFWIQDSSSAAAYNGLYVFRPGSGDELPATIVPGRIITIVGNIDEFKGVLTELAHVEIVSEGGMADVTVLDSIALDTLKADAQYEGVLVSVPGATVVTGSMAGCAEFCNFTIGATGSVLFANDDIFRHNVSAGACYGTFNGIMHYDTSKSRIVILPLADGLSVGGDACN